MNPWIRWRDDEAQTEPAWRWLAEWVAMPALLATPPRPLADMGEPLSRLDESARNKFIARLGAERVRQDLAARARHAASGTADRLRVRTGDLSRLPDAVLYPKNSEDVLALLALCARADIAVSPFGSGSGSGALPERGAHAALVSFDLSALSHLISVDTMSGLARAEAGITAEDLARQLAAHGMMLKGEIAGSLGGYIACNHHVPWLQATKLATPQGLVASGSAPGSQGALGIITSASIRVRALPAKIEYRRYLFADFAGGLAALREAERQGLARAGASLSDAGETRFQLQMERIGQHPTFSQWLGELYRQVRRFDREAALLTIGFCGTESEADAARRRFASLSRRLGALTLGACTPQKSDHRDMLLDRGLALDWFETTTHWSKLPAVYSAMRTSLDRTMRAQAPRNGAHGQVLARVSDATHEGAKLRFTIIFPRLLGSDVVQAEIIREAAFKALAEFASPDGPLEEQLRAAIRQTLDPKAILNPGKL
ncbi:MAG TPA: FAD-binding oxidoreductase [Rhizomicrobium sp.]|jgi:alkyldihydroxyacetonephosphate synthase